MWNSTKKSWTLRWQIPTTCSPCHFPSATKYKASLQFPSSFARSSGHVTDHKWCAQLSYKTSPMILLYMLFPHLLILMLRTILKPPLEESRASISLETSNTPPPSPCPYIPYTHTHVRVHKHLETNEQLMWAGSKLLLCYVTKILLFIHHKVQDFLSGHN